jgi:hypothetical protein
MATASTVPVAPVGYIGYGTIFGYPVRGMNFNIKAHQQVFNGDPVTNEADQPIWHVGPIEVDGDVSWPIVIGDPVTYKIIQSTITRQASRGGKKTLEPGDIEAWFPPAQGTKSYSRKATNCIVNRLSFKGTAGERVDGTINAIGLGLTENVGVSTPVPFDMGRILTWSDVVIEANIADAKKTARFAGCTIKEFSFEINNNVTRANTYCWPDSALGTEYGATALVLGRRQVSGSMTFIGSSGTQDIAQNNMTRSISDDELAITFGVVVAKFHRVVYELQQIDLTAGVVYGRTNFTAHGNGPGEPSIEFTMSEQASKDQQNALKSIDQEMSGRGV